MKKPKSGIHKRPKDLEKLLDALVDAVNGLMDKVEGMDVMLGTVITQRAEENAKAKKETTNEKV